MSDITSQQLVVFSLGSEEYALPIGAVHEIIRFTEPRTVASDVPWIRGVIGLRGKIIPIFDMAARMGLAVAGQEPGKIVIVDSGNGEVILAVEDDGPGIPADLHEKVFERFFRAHGDRSGSSGLGLSIVRAVAESHQGSVRLEPPLDGRGARFVVRFPVKKPSEAEA